MPHLPRVSAFPIAAENSFLTAAGVALKIPAKERNSPLIGHPAPEILAKDHLGRDVSLHATIKLGRPIVLYFFPLAGSPHCTKQSCSFRDAVGTSPIFNDLNALVIGISQDPPARSRRFVDEHHLGFRILHDSNRHIMDAWGVGRRLFGLIDARCTFVIDHDGIVRGMLDGVCDYQGHYHFAQTWLCRIEHELSSRQRFYLEYQPDDMVACDKLTRNLKVVYGDALPSRGIAAAPRHGAARAASTSSPTPPPPHQMLASLSILAQPNASGSISRAKSRPNLTKWLRPSPPPNPTYHEPLHVDYKLTNRSIHHVTRHSHPPSTLAHHPAVAPTTHKPPARVRSLRLPDSYHSPPFSPNHSDQRSPQSRHESGSGSGWATPSTTSARSVSTGETSHTSPAHDSRDSKHATMLDAAINTEVGAQHSQLQPSASASASASVSVSARRQAAPLDAAPNGAVNRTTESNSVVTSARSSSLFNSASVENASTHPTTTPPHASTDSRLTFMPHALRKPTQQNPAATVYANGNIAKMPLLPSANLETTYDSMATVLDTRSRSAHSSSDPSTDSTYTLTGASSLPVPPRPSARNATAGVAASATASVRVHKHARRPTNSPSPNGQLAPAFVATCSSTPRSEHSEHSEHSAEDGYTTDRDSSPNAFDTSNMQSVAALTRLESRRRIQSFHGQHACVSTITPNITNRSRDPSNSTTVSTSLGRIHCIRRTLPPQSPVPQYAPPTTPSIPPSSSPSASPSTSFVTATIPFASTSTSFRALRTITNHPSPSTSVSGTFFDTDAKPPHPMHRRLSNTPSLTTSVLSANDASDYDYSSSIADSTNTFGGLED